MLHGFRASTLTAGKHAWGILWSMKRKTWNMKRNMCFGCRSLPGLFICGCMQRMERESVSGVRVGVSSRAREMETKMKQEHGL